MKPMKLRWILTAIMVVTIITAILSYGAYTAYESNLIDLKTLVTWTVAGVIIEMAAGIIGYLLGRKANAEEIGKAIAEESQKLKAKEEAEEKHTKLIYSEINLFLSGSLSFSFMAVGGMQDRLSCTNPDEFPKELASHLEAYNALSIATSARELCKTFNTDLENAINDTIKEFIELVEKLAKKEHAEGRKFSLQRYDYDIVPNPRSFYSPDIVARNIYYNAGNFQPYIIETIDGRFKIGNTVAETDNRDELETFTRFVNEYSLTKIELFKKVYDRKQEAMNKTKEFSDALKEIMKKLDSGHRLEGRCYLCPNS